MDTPTRGIDPDPLRELRVWLIRVILWSLGLAAALGVLAVLTGGYDVGLRAVATALLTAAAAGVLWTIGSLPRGQHAARMTGLVATLLSYAGFLLSIWDIGSQDKLAMSSLLTGSSGLVAVAALMLRSGSRSRWAGRWAVGSVALLLITAIIGVWAMPGREWRDELIATWFAFGASALLVCLCLIDHTFTARDWWRWAGIGGAGGAFLLGLGMIWKFWPESETLYAAGMTLSVVVAHANLLLLAPLSEKARWLQQGTIGAAVATGLGIDLVLLTGGSPGEFLGRMLAAASILSGMGTLAVIVLALFARQRSTPRVHQQPAFLTHIEVRCPVCQTRQSLALGGSTCRACGLAIDVRLTDHTPPQTPDTADASNSPQQESDNRQPSSVRPPAPPNAVWLNQ